MLYMFAILCKEIGALTRYHNRMQDVLVGVKPKEYYEDLQKILKSKTFVTNKVHILQQTYARHRTQMRGGGGPRFSFF